MKSLLAFAVAGVAAVGFSPEERPVQILLAGDLKSYLSPCGCVKPMSGGIKRMVSAVRSIRASGPTIFVLNGQFLSGPSRQDEMKSETLGQALKASGVDAVFPTKSDLQLAEVLLENAHRLSGETFLSATGEAAQTWAPSEREAQGLVIRGARRWTEELRDAQPSLLLWDGNLESARSVAAKIDWPCLDLYRSAAKPSAALESIGKATLVGGGEKGKVLVQVSWLAGKIKAARIIDLGPQVPDDPATSQLKAQYLERVEGERLLEKLPRRPSEPYAGSLSCSSCHQEAHREWLVSEHSTALRTLEADGHDADPDCVGCHVVGLEDETGFQSRQKTPRLANVGCESCHGPSAAHVSDPERNRTPRDARQSCGSCHNVDHSPGFQYETYWPQIEHK